MSTIQRADVLSTRHLDVDLKGHTVRSTAFTVTAQALKLALQIVSIVILARLLSPSDFGLVAMVSVITMLLGPLQDGGLSVATIQRQDITHAQVSNLFWLNTALGLTLAVLVVIAAPVIAAIYGEPRLTNIAVVMAASFLIGGLSVQFHAVLRRQMRFRALAIIDVVSLAAGIVASIGLAALGMGYWALVAAPLVTTAGRTLFVLMIGGWCPSWVKRGAGTRSLLVFGANATGASVVARMWAGATPFAIGILGGPHILGLYNRGHTLLLPYTQLLSPMMRVLQPALSRVAADSIRFRRAALNVIRKLLLFSVPISVILVVLADLIVRLFLGGNWQEATIIVQILSAFVPVELIGILLIQFFIVRGRSDVAFRCQLISLLVIVVSILIGSFWGWLGILVCTSLSGVIVRIPILIFFANRFLSICFRDIFATIVPFFILAILMSISLMAGRLYIASFSDVGVLAITSFFGSLVYFMAGLAVKATREDIKEIFYMCSSQIEFLKRASSEASPG